MPKKAKKYDESSIDVFEGLEAVRKKPAMYMGQRGKEMAFRMLREVVENSIDEYAAGRNDYVCIVVTGKKKQRMAVIDKGAGIPVGKHRKTGISTLTTVATMLHAGGKFDESSGEGFRGTHGVGASCVNALSSVFEIYTCREGQWYSQTFSEGKPTSKVVKTKFPKEFVGMAAKNKGTVVIFEPDYSIVGPESLLDMKELKAWCKTSATLNSGLVIEISDGKTSEKFVNKKGPEGFLKEIIEKSKCATLGKCFSFESKNLALAIQWTDFDGENIQSYVSGSATENGGTHVKGLYNAINKVIKTLVTKKDKATAKDLRYGIVGFINYKMSNAEFKSQTKEELVSFSAEKDVQSQVEPELVKWLKANQATVKKIIKRANAIRKADLEAKKLRQAAGKLKDVKKKTLLPGKLVACSRKTPIADRELYLLEGDSASGTAKCGRDHMFQEILPLKGKPINPAKSKSISKTLANEEVANILTCVGIDPVRKTAQYRTGKVMLLADSDPDGRHITQLLLTVLYAFAPQMFDDGMVYIVDAPMFFANYKGKKIYGYTLKDIQSKVKPTDKVIFSRAKGWGEVPWEVLEETAFNPETRRLIKIKPVAKKEGVEFMKVVGDNTATRKKILGV